MPLLTGHKRSRSAILWEKLQLLQEKPKTPIVIGTPESVIARPSTTNNTPCRRHTNESTCSSLDDEFSIPSANESMGNIDLPVQEPELKTTQSSSSLSRWSTLLNVLPGLVRSRDQSGTQSSTDLAGMQSETVSNNDETSGLDESSLPSLPPEPTLKDKIMAKFGLGHDHDEPMNPHTDEQFQQYMSDAMSHHGNIEELSTYMTDFSTHLPSLPFISQTRRKRVSCGSSHQLSAFLGVEGIFSAEHYRKRFVEIVDGTLLIWTHQDGILKKRLILNGSKISTPDDSKKFVVKIASPFFGTLRLFCKDEAEQMEWVKEAEYWAIQDTVLQQDELLWSQAQELFDDYIEKFSGVAIHTSEQHIDHLKPHIIAFFKWALDELEVEYDLCIEARIMEALNDYTTLMKHTNSIKQNVNWVLKPILANLMESLMPHGAIVDLEEKYNTETELGNLPSMNIVIITVGSRGDVQPYIAMGLKLQSEGHKVRLATHEVFREWVQSYKLDFFCIAGDPNDLMKVMVDNDVFISKSFIKNNIVDKRIWLKQLLKTSWAACTQPWDMIGEESDFLSDGNPKPNRYRADIIISNPVSFAGPHLAERLGIPLYMSFTMPWSPTREVPPPLLCDGNEGSNFRNYLAFVAVDRVLWYFTRDAINKWRSKVGLPRIAQKDGPTLLADRHIPFIYCFSPYLMPKPKDWGAWISVVGFFFLDQSSKGYTPDPELAAFLAAGEPPIFVGFGSIVVKDPEALTQIIVETLISTGRRAIVQRGWSDLSAEVPENILFVNSVPHDWLFQRCCAVVHHGGAGTTSAGLLAGLPTVIVSFFGDQFFWGKVISDAGAGPVPVPYEKLTVKKLSEAIEFALKPQVIEKAQVMGKNITESNGVDNAIQWMTRRLPVLAMRDSLVPTLKAEIACEDCNLRLSIESDHVIHCSDDPEKMELRSHGRTHLVYVDWARRTNESNGGYHGRPLTENEINYITSYSVDKDLEAKIWAVFCGVKDDSGRPELPESSICNLSYTLESLAPYKQPITNIEEKN